MLINTILHIFDFTDMPTCRTFSVLTFDIPEGEVSIAGGLGGEGEVEAMT